MTIKKACFTYAIPGYWLQDEHGENHFSSDGRELTEEGRRIAHSFPNNCFKDIRPEHTAKPQSHKES